jgi:hypothetical protein
MICTDCTSYLWMLAWRWSSKTARCCHNTVKIFIQCCCVLTVTLNILFYFAYTAELWLSCYRYIYTDSIKLSSVEEAVGVQVTDTISNKRCLSNCEAIYLKYPRELVGRDWLPLHDDISATLCCFEVLSLLGCAARGWGWRFSET